MKYIHNSHFHCHRALSDPLTPPTSFTCVFIVCYIIIPNIYRYFSLLVIVLHTAKTRLNIPAATPEVPTNIPCLNKQEFYELIRQVVACMNGTVTLDELIEHLANSVHVCTYVL